MAIIAYLRETQIDGDCFRDVEEAAISVQCKQKAIQALQQIDKMYVGQIPKNWFDFDTYYLQKIKLLHIICMQGN